MCGCELYLALKYSVYTDLRGPSLIVKEKERRTMRKILLTARRWDLIFDVRCVEDEPKHEDEPKQAIKKKRNKKKKKNINKNTRNFYLLILEHTVVVIRRKVK